MVDCEEELIVTLEDKLIDLFVKHAKEDGLKNVKEAEIIKYPFFI